MPPAFRRGHTRDHASPEVQIREAPQYIGKVVRIEGGLGRFAPIFSGIAAPSHGSGKDAAGPGGGFAGCWYLGEWWIATILGLPSEFGDRVSGRLSSRERKLMTDSSLCQSSGPGPDGGEPVRMERSRFSGHTFACFCGMVMVLPDRN